MKISVFGLGYVGAVTAGCLARRGHTIVGVDVQAQKVASSNQGVPPIIEPELDQLLKQALAQQLFHATTSCGEALAATELSIVCVGTPSTVTGGLDLSYVRQVVKEIANGLRKRGKPHWLIFRSTMLPGSTARLTSELLVDLESSGQLKIFYFPEFLREGTAVADFEDPSLAVVGTRDGGRPPAELMTQLFGEKAAVVNWPTAEMVKYACNAFHATKVTFANEIGRIGKQMQIDSRAIMNLLCQDTRLNLSPYYLRPGSPFGGSCLPKDVCAINYQGRQHGLNLPLLESLMPSNERHLQSLLGQITESGQNEIIILGLSFKTDTDDLRGSPMVEVAQVLLGRGYKPRVYDPALNLAALVGSNKREIDTRMPHLASLLCPDLATALGKQGLIVAAHRCVPMAELAQHVTPQHVILDVNGWPELRSLPAKYQGFCW